jgi:hypothetical protein
VGAVVDWPPGAGHEDFDLIVEMPIDQIHG